MKRWIVLMAILTLSLLINLPFAHAVLSLPEECQMSSLPGNDPRYPDNQIILTCIPQNWNGHLVVYAHGYVPVQFPLSLPLEELILPDGRTVPEILLSSGFAFATSSYHKNGYAVEQAGNDLNALVGYFKTYIAPYPVQRVYITGASEGGLITTMLLERYPETFHGGLALCGPVGGATYQIKYLGDFRVVFDYFFPQVFPFRMADVPEDAYLYWEYYMNSISEAILSNPDATEQLYSVTRAARDLADPVASSINTALSILFYSIWGTNDLIDVAGGQPYGNMFTWYRGSSNDFKLNAGVERVNADRAARDYTNRFYNTTGLLQRPLVTLHTTGDELVPFSHEVIYLTRAILKGRSHLLTILPVPRYGHCNFTAEEILGAFAFLVLRTGGTVDTELMNYLMTLPNSLR